MNINVHILRETHILGIIEPHVKIIKRAGSSELKNPNILYLNGEKGKISRYKSPNVDNLLNGLDAEYNFNTVKYRHPAEISYTHRKLLTVLKIQYKAEIVIYRTKTSGYYSQYPLQIVGLQFEDKKYMMKFLIKYGHFIC